MIKNCEYETEEIMTERLVLMKGNKRDFLSVYEYDFRKLKNVDGVFEFSKSNNSEIKEWFKKGESVYYKTCKKAHVFDWIIYFKNKPVGNVLAEELTSNIIKINFNLHPTYWGRGYMPEALSSVLDYLFKIGYNNVTCEFYDGNKKAKRVLEKLGFKPYKIKADILKGKNKNMIDAYELIMKKEDWLSRTTKIKL